MKTILKIAAVFAVTVGLVSCHDDVTIPDPGFDMSETVIDTLRRDTSSIYHISFNVKAPNGVDYIQILNGRTYEVMEELDEYAGKKNFRFEHDFDLSGCDSEKDSTFIYNIRIRTKDLRGYNKSIRILHMRKSHPEITGPSSTINIFGRAFIFDGTITTGYYSIESVRVTLNGEEVLNLGSNELNGTNTYNLYQRLTRDFVAGEQYVYNVIVTDSNGETKTFSYNLIGSKLKKPVAFRYSTKSRAEASVLHYNDKEQLESFFFTYLGRNYLAAMHYDDEGRLVTILRVGKGGLKEGSYGSGMGCWYEYNDDGSIKRYCDFNFTTSHNGVVHKMLDPFWNRKELIPESCVVADLVGTDREGFITGINGYNDYTLNKYMEYNGKRYVTDMTGNGSNHIGPFEYLEDFEEGKLLYTALVGSYSEGAHPFNGLSPDSFAKITSYAPVLNPLYIPDLPTMLHWRYATSNFMIMFGGKYAVSTVTRRNPYDKEEHTIPYTVREDGLLKSFGSYTYSTSSLPTFTYYYDDEPDDEWRPYLVSGVEESMQYMK